MCEDFDMTTTPRPRGDAVSLDPNDVRLTLVEDKPKRGAWTNGPSPCWITLLHKPTMQSVTVYGHQQYRVRQQATALLELMLDDWDGKEPRFKENMDYGPNIGPRIAASIRARGEDREDG